MQQNIVCIYAQQQKEKKIQWNNGGYHFSQSSGPKWMDGVQCRKAPEQICTYVPTYVYGAVVHKGQLILE